VTLPHTGARILLASDGLWDAVAAKTAAHHVRSLPATKAAKELVREVPPVPPHLPMMRAEHV
jgi:serine/threonine protein phosphatase PrpC